MILGEVRQNHLIYMSYCDLDIVENIADFECRCENKEDYLIVFSSEIDLSSNFHSSPRKLYGVCRTSNIHKNQSTGRHSKEISRLYSQYVASVSSRVYHDAKQYSNSIKVDGSSFALEANIEKGMVKHRNEKPSSFDQSLNVQVIEWTTPSVFMMLV